MRTLSFHQVTLDQVYESLTSRSIGAQLTSLSSPTFEVAGENSSVNVYVSNAADKPADKTEMTIDDRSPFFSSIYRVRGQVRWILFEQDEGSPVVNTMNLVVVT